MVRLLEDRGQGQRLVLASSPFYAEGGGQVGDQGTVEALDGSFPSRSPTARRGGRRPRGQARGDASHGGPGVRARADAPRRAAVRANHAPPTSCTRRCARPWGPRHPARLVCRSRPPALRLQPSQGLSDEEVLEVQRRVNAAILGDGAVVSTEESPPPRPSGASRPSSARSTATRFASWTWTDGHGACGGPTWRSGEIGPFVLLSEKAIQAGVRRIEAVTAQAAHGVLENQARLVSDLASS